MIKKNFSAQKNLHKQGKIKRRLQRCESLTVLREHSSLTKPRGVLAMNKKGGEKYLSLWWFFTLVLISAGLVIGISANILGDVNVKGIEAKTLAERLGSCISQDTSEFLTTNFDIFSKCYLSRGVFASDRFFEIKVFALDSCQQIEGKLVCQNELKKEVRGDLSLRKSCSETIKGDLPSCYNKLIYSSNYIITISTGSNAAGSRVSRLI